MPRVKLTEKFVDPETPKGPSWEIIKAPLLKAEPEDLKKVPGLPLLVDITTGVVYLDDKMLQMIQ